MPVPFMETIQGTLVMIVATQSGTQLQPYTVKHVAPTYPDFIYKWNED